MSRHTLEAATASPKGSYEFLRSVGRTDDYFYPFQPKIPTTLRVHRHLDRFYDVKYNCTTKDRHVRTMFFGQGSRKLRKRRAPEAETRQKVVEAPDCCTYNPAVSFESLKAYGKQFHKFGKAQRMTRPMSAEEIEQKGREFAAFQAQLHEAEATSPRPPSRGIDFKRTLAREAPVMGTPRPPSARSVAETPAAALPPPSPGRYSISGSGAASRPTTPQRSARPDSRVKGGQFAREERRTLRRLAWNTSTYPSANEGVDMKVNVKYTAQDKHVPRVSLGRTSSREPQNDSKKNAAVLEHMLKRLCGQEAKAEAKAAQVESSFCTNSRTLRGCDIWLTGGRPDIAIQGRVEEGPPAAAWELEEAESITRRIKTIHRNERIQRSREKKTKRRPRGMEMGNTGMANDCGTARTYNIYREQHIQQVCEESQRYPEAPAGSAAYTVHLQTAARAKALEEEWKKDLKETLEAVDYDGEAAAAPPPPPAS